MSIKVYVNSLFVLIATALIACNNKVGVQFLVINKSGSDIDSLVIEPNVNRQYKSLANDRRLTYTTNMNGIPKVDGAYHIQFKSGAAKKNYTYGYYTNGAPLENYTTITLLSDTFKIDRLY